MAETVTPELASHPDDSRRLRGVVRLYVAGNAPNSLLALHNLRAALGECLADTPYELEVVDVIQERERALDDGVSLTPVLVRLIPRPERRIVGDLGDRALLLRFLKAGLVS